MAQRRKQKCAQCGGRFVPRNRLHIVCSSKDCQRGQANEKARDRRLQRDAAAAAAYELGLISVEPVTVIERTTVWRAARDLGLLKPIGGSTGARRRS